MSFPEPLKTLGKLPFFFMLLFILFWVGQGHIWQRSGLFPGPAFRNYPWQAQTIWNAKDQTQISCVQGKLLLLYYIIPALRGKIILKQIPEKNHPQLPLLSDQLG